MPARTPGDRLRQQWEKARQLLADGHLFRARNLVQAGGLSVSNREHRAMVDALASGNRERAQEAFFRHVERAKTRVASTLN